MRPDFDTEDPEGKEVVRKVLAGTIKGCSLGIMFDPADMVKENGKIILKNVSCLKCPSWQFLPMETLLRSSLWMVNSFLKRKSIRFAYPLSPQNLKRKS